MNTSQAARMMGAAHKVRPVARPTRVRDLGLSGLSLNLLRLSDALGARIEVLLAPKRGAR